MRVLIVYAFWQNKWQLVVVNKQCITIIEVPLHFYCTSVCVCVRERERDRERESSIAPVSVKDPNNWIV